MNGLIELQVERPAAGGRMLARHEGRIVLVWGAIPGEHVRARVERIAKGVVYADTADVLEPSPDRREATADWRCGGNVLAHVTYERQVALKSEIIVDAFRRIGRMTIEPVYVVASPEQGYRMRARLHVREGRIGFFREGTHEVCDAAATQQLLPDTNAWIAEAEAALRHERLSGITAIELAENIDASARACHLELAAGEAVERYAPLASGGRLTGLSATRADRPDVRQLAGVPTVSDSIPLTDDRTGAVVTLARDVRAFFQGNRYLLGRLVRHVLERVPPGPVTDLYAGVGLFGLAVAARGEGGVTLVEGDRVSGDDLMKNAAAWRARVSVARQSVESFLSHHGRRGRRDGASTGADADRQTFIVDPPRTGMSAEAMRGLVARVPSTVVYVSCDVATLARDARALAGSGYRLDGITGFDLFPNTAHVESVAVFTR